MDAELSVRSILDKDADHNTKATDKKAEEGFKKKLEDKISERGQLDGWRLRGDMVESKQGTLEEKEKGSKKGRPRLFWLIVFNLVMEQAW